MRRPGDDHDKCGHKIRTKANERKCQAVCADGCLQRLARNVLTICFATCDVKALGGLEEKTSANKKNALSSDVKEQSRWGVFGLCLLHNQRHTGTACRQAAPRWRTIFKSCYWVRQNYIWVPQLATTESWRCPLEARVHPKVTSRLSWTVSLPILITCVPVCACVK